MTPDFAADVKLGLARQPKQLHPKYFYDALGSSLFDAICRLPWYRITRAECALLARHAPSIVSRLEGGRIIELGCGNGEKLLVLVEALREQQGAVGIHLVDVSRQALDRTVARLDRVGFASVAHEDTYEAGLHRAVASPSSGPSLVLFLGSNIGNFDPADGRAFLSQIRAGLRPGDRLLLGVDLTKPEADLLLAYDDPLGVTAAFNRNLLVRINNELEGDFDLAAFEHRAVWNAVEQRVEMHLVSTRAQRVTIPAAGMVVDFADRESIWTESSYKYEPDQVVQMGHAAGFAAREQWIAAEARFALTLFEVAEIKA